MPEKKKIETKRKSSAEMRTMRKWERNRSTINNNELDIQCRYQFNHNIINMLVNMWPTCVRT